MKRNPLVLLGQAGQSPWLDYIERGLVRSGELARLVAEDGIKGVTSNPTIFEKAISGGHEYDAQIQALAAAGSPVLEAYTELAVEDIRLAADVLRPVHDATGGADGFVSLEVDPDVAGDTAATIRRARDLFARVSRRNVFIKVPATSAGIPAIEELIAGGIPVNVTLIFSVRRYGEAAESYLRGLERLIADGGDPRPTPSVASFFVSRVDTAVDRLLDAVVERFPGSPRAATALTLKGRVAVANTRLAYEAFRRIVAGDRWKALAAKGARVQRPLWASTGTKNPKYSDVKYVEELIGPDTVNTMPLSTIDAFRDHGRVADALRGKDAGARKVLGDLGLMDIGIEEVCAALEEEGVKSFLDSYRKLLSAIERRIEAARVA